MRVRRYRYENARNTLEPKEKKKKKKKEKEFPSVGQAGKRNVPN